MASNYTVSGSGSTNTSSYNFITPSQTSVINPNANNVTLPPSMQKILNSFKTNVNSEVSSFKQTYTSYEGAEASCVTAAGQIVTTAKSALQTFVNSITIPGLQTRAKNQLPSVDQKLDSMLSAFQTQLSQLAVTYTQTNISYGQGETSYMSQLNQSLTYFSNAVQNVVTSTMGQYSSQGPSDYTGLIVIGGFIGVLFLLSFFYKGDKK